MRACVQAKEASQQRELRAPQRSLPNQEQQQQQHHHHRHHHHQHHPHPQMVMLVVGGEPSLSPPTSPPRCPASLAAG